MFFAALDTLFHSSFVVLFVPTLQMFSSSVVCVGLCEQKTAGARWVFFSPVFLC